MRTSCNWRVSLARDGRSQKQFVQPVEKYDAPVINDGHAGFSWKFSQVQLNTKQVFIALGEVLVSQMGLETWGEMDGGIFLQIWRLNCCPRKTSCFVYWLIFWRADFEDFEGVLAVQVVVSLSVVRFLIDSLWQRLWQLTGGPPVVVGKVAAKRQRLWGGEGELWPSRHGKTGDNKIRH